LPRPVRELAGAREGAKNRRPAWPRESCETPLRSATRIQRGKRPTAEPAAAFPAPTMQTWSTQNVARATVTARILEMRHLVSGAAGFIGSHLCEKLLAEG